MGTGVTWIAIYAAVVSTIVALWNFYRDWIQRTRLLVDVNLMEEFPGRREVVTWTLRNRGNASLHVTHLSGHLDTKWAVRRARYLRRPIDGKAFLFSFNATGVSLPVEVGALNSVVVSYPIKHADLPIARRFVASTADGREWDLPRRRVSELMQKRGEAIAARTARGEGTADNKS